MAPAYLAADCQLVSGKGHHSSPVFCQLKDVLSDGSTAAMETDVLLLQLLCCGKTFQLI